MLTKFNVLEFDFNTEKVQPYDVLPYFRNSWNDKFHKEEKEEIRKSKSKEKLKNWIKSQSQYQFWSRCQYECLIGPWPYGSYKMNQKLKEFLTSDFNLDNISDSIRLDNIITEPMQKIDVHYQIMMNIDIITDILYKEFNI